MPSPSDGARCLKVGEVHEKPDLSKAFHERRSASLGENLGILSSPRKKIEFGIGGDAISL